MKGFKKQALKEAQMQDGARGESGQTLLSLLALVLTILIIKDFILFFIVNTTTTVAATTTTTTTTATTSTTTPTETTTTTTTSSSTTTTPTTTTTTESTTTTTTAAATTTTTAYQCKCGMVNRVSRIVGGAQTDVNEYPWQVAITSLLSSLPFCGGSVISNMWILTAAHCVALALPFTIAAVIGEHDWSLLTDTDATKRILVSQSGGVLCAGGVSGSGVGGGVVVGAVCGCAGDLSSSDASKLIFNLRNELAAVRQEVRSLAEENRDLRGKVEVLTRKGQLNREDDWKVVNKGSTKMVLKKNYTFRLQVVNLFSSLRDEGDSGGSNSSGPIESDRCTSDRRNGSGKSSQVKSLGKSPKVGVTHPLDKSRSLVIVGDSLCRYVDRKLRHRVRGKYFFPGAGMKKVGESINSWIEKKNVVCLIAGGNDEVKS
ncbi:hypothetical protein SK128_023117 [Halocaridina rubra]|uniref:Peptidase S1 domain-containing protein n=1 Tax=Halocaridina rubra TaxID=373956 RepID=A0AAN8XDQ0_HALRR